MKTIKGIFVILSVIVFTCAAIGGFTTFPQGGGGGGSSFGPDGRLNTLFLTNSVISDLNVVSGHSIRVTDGDLLVTKSGGPIKIETSDSSVNFMDGSTTADASGNVTTSHVLISGGGFQDVDFFASDNISYFDSMGYIMACATTRTALDSFHTGTNQNGIAITNIPSSGVTLTSNLLAPSSISFPATTVNWTNTTGNRIFVFINNSAITGTAIKINGTTVFTLTTGDCTLPLQPGEYFSETYTVGTPTATIKPF